MIQLFKKSNSSIFIPFLAIFCLFLLSCTVNSQKNRGSSRTIPTVDDPGNIGAGPSVNDPNFDPPEEACDLSTPVEVNAVVDGQVLDLANFATLDFGLNQTGEVKCYNISYTPKCARASVEITDGSSKTILPGEGGGHQSSHEFIASVLGDPGSLNVCYQRLFNGDNPSHVRLNPGDNQVRNHVGQLNVVINDSFATVVNLRGTTIPPVIQLAQPVNNLLVWQASGHEYVDHSQPGTPEYESYLDRPYFKHYKIPVSGMIHPNGRQLLKSPQQVSLAVKRGGITSFAPINAETGRFGEGGLLVEMPVGPAFNGQLFTLEVSVDTIHGKMAIERTIIPYTAPDFQLDIRNQGDVSIGNQIPEAIYRPTNSKRIIAGVKIKNAHVSAPNSDHPLCARLRLKKGNGNFQTVDKFTDGYQGVIGCAEPGYVPLYLDDFSYTNDGECKGGFVDGLTPYGLAYCDIFEEIKEDFANGVNTLELTLCSDYTATMPGAIGGCLVKTSSIIVNTSKPLITMTRIGDKVVVDQNVADQPNVIVTPIGNQLTIRGFIDQTQKESADGECMIELRVNNSLASNSPAINLCEGNYLTDEGGVGNPSEGQGEDLRRLSFIIPLSFNNGANSLIKGKNLLRFMATNSLGHTTIKVFSFDIGNEKRVSNSFVQRDEGRENDISIQLGQKVIDRGNSKVEEAPISFKLSKASLLDDENLIKVLTKFMNENVKMSDLVTGGGLRVQRANGRDFLLPVNNINNSVEMARMVKGSMPELLKAALYHKDRNNNRLFAQNDVRDPAGNVMTHALIQPYMIPHLNDRLLTDNMINSISWPKFCLTYNCREFPVIEGKWKIENLQVTDDGYIDMDLTYTGLSAETDAEKIEALGLNPNQYRRLPAFMAPIIAYGVLQNGTIDVLVDEGFDLSGLDNDLINDLVSDVFGREGTLPLIINLSEIRINLNNMLRILDASFTTNAQGKEVLDTYCGDEVCECRALSRSCKPYIHVDKDEVLNDRNSFVEFDPYQDCDDLLMDLLGNVRIGEAATFNRGNGEFLPIGCRNNRRSTSPILLDVTSDIGRNYFNSRIGTHPKFLEAFERVLERTVRNKIASLPYQMHLAEGHQLAINSYIDPKGYNYPDWYPERDRIEELNFAIIHNKAKDDVELKLRENVENGDNVLLFAKPHLKEMEFSTAGSDISFKLPISMGSENSPIVRQGFVYQSFADDFSYNDDYPLPPAEDRPSFSTSFDFANFMNAFSKITYNQNLHTILGDILGLKLYGQDPDNIGATELVVDIVTLGRLGICDSLLEILNPRLSAGALFANMTNYFPFDNTQLKITLDPDHPATFTLMEPDEVLYGETETEDGQILTGTDATLVVGLSNIRMDAYNLEESIVDDEIRFQGRDRVLSVRMDMLIKIDLKFQGNEVYAYIHPNKSQVIYPSVIDGAGSFNDPEVVESLWEQVIKVVMPQLSTEGVATPSFIMRFPDSLSKIGDITYVPADEIYTPPANNAVEGIVLENRLTNLASNGECIPGEEPLYVGDRRPVPDPIANGDNPVVQPNPHGGFVQTPRSIEDLVHNCKVRAFNNGLSFKEDFLCDYGIGEITTRDTEVRLDTSYGGFHFKTDIDLDLILGLDEYLE